MPPTAGSSTVELDLGAAAPPAFYFDLGAPEGYLTAERILPAMPVATEWIPIHLGVGEEPDWGRIEQRVGERGMQRLVVPPAFPFDAELVNLAATYAKQVGRVVSFAQAAFRQAYAGGRDLSQPDWVLVAGSACEMHPTATLKAVTTRLVRDGLRRATMLARERGVQRTPAIWTGDAAGGVVLHGDDALEEAAVLLGAAAA